MKKFLKYIAAALVALMLIPSCSILKLGSSSAKSSGVSTGLALLGLYAAYKASGKIDLSNATNLINLGKILTGAKSLTEGDSSFVDLFTSGLIDGSSNLVNASNASSIVSALTSLGNLDSSAILNAATAASANQSFQVNNSTAGVSTALSSLNSIFGLLE